jgi:hypothetical protein
MKRLFWPFVFFSAPLVGGCGPMVTAPAPPLDQAPKAATETATFALG